MKSKKPCANCPFRKGMSWYGAYGSQPNAASKIEALESVDSAGVFSCHKTNPDSNVFIGKMINDDCAGFKMMIDNMREKDKHPEVVNDFNETGPEFDLKYWATKSGYQSKLNLI